MDIQLGRAHMEMVPSITTEQPLAVFLKPQVAMSYHTVIGQQYKDTLGSDFQSAIDNFVGSGQVWALLIGLILGYMFRSFTAY